MANDETKRPFLSSLVGGVIRGIYTPMTSSPTSRASRC